MIKGVIGFSKVSGDLAPPFLKVEIIFILKPFKPMSLYMNNTHK